MAWHINNLLSEYFPDTFLISIVFFKKSYKKQNQELKCLLATSLAACHTDPLQSGDPLFINQLVNQLFLSTNFMQGTVLFTLGKYTLPINFVEKVIYKSMSMNSDCYMNSEMEEITMN